MSDTERHCYENLAFSLAQHPSESTERLLARLLAFALEYEQELAFGGGVSTADEAPVWLREPDGRVRHWIEIGQPDPKRIPFLARRCERVSLYCYGPQAARWWQQQGISLGAVKNFSAWLLDYTVLETLSAGVAPGFEFQLTRSEDHLFLGAGEVQAEMTLIRLNP